MSIYKDDLSICQASAEYPAVLSYRWLASEQNISNDMKRIAEKEI